MEPRLLGAESKQSCFFLETPGSPVILQSTDDRPLSLSSTNKSRDEDGVKRLPERQTSSPSAFSHGLKTTKESVQEEKEKDEKQSHTNDSLRLFADAQLADPRGASSSELLLPSGTLTQIPPAFTKRVTPGRSQDEDKDLEEPPETDSKGRTGASKNVPNVMIF